MWRLISLLISVAVIAAMVPIIANSSKPSYARLHMEFPGWPGSYDNKPIQALPITEKEQAFAKDFPGEIGRFSDGKREIIIRWVKGATRRLHPASDCFKSIGYAIHPLPLEKTADGSPQACFLASKKQTRLKICEHIRDASGRVWPDVSSWYWSAIWQSEPPPAWSFVVAEPIAGL